MKRWSCSFGQWGVVRTRTLAAVTDLATRPAVLACELLHRGARFVVVGGAARWLLGESAAPRDLDVAVKDAMVPALVAALDGIGVTRSAVSIRRARQVHLETSWGPLDVFLGPATSPDTGAGAGTVRTVAFGSFAIPVWAPVGSSTQMMRVAVDEGRGPLTEA